MGGGRNAAWVWSNNNPPRRVQENNCDTRAPPRDLSRNDESITVHYKYHSSYNSTTEYRSIIVLVLLVILQRPDEDSLPTKCGSVFAKISLPPRLYFIVSTSPRHATNLDNRQQQSHENIPTNHVHPKTSPLAGRDARRTPSKY